MSVNKRVCGPCLDENIEKEGIVYCRECEEPLCGKCKQDHERIKVSKHHKLCDLSEIPPQEIQELLRSLITCPNHDKEEVVYLCKDHDVTCCNKCFLANHRKCEEVKVLSDIMHETNVDDPILKTVLCQMQQKGESLLEHERKHEEMIADTERKAMLLLQDVKQKLQDTYNKIENTLLSSIADKKKVIFERMSAQRKRVRQILNDIEHQSFYIEQVEKFGSENHVLLVQRQIDKETRPRLQSSVDIFDRSRTQHSFKCTANTCLDTLLIEIRNILRLDDAVCDVSETGSDSDLKKSSTHAERNIQLQSELSLQEIQLFDSSPDTCILIDNCIVISLNTTPSLLVFDGDNTTVLSKFTCQSNPWTISKTGASDMVITLPHESKLAFAQIRHGNVHLVAEMQTSVPYHNVAMDSALNQYICLSRSIGQIDVLNSAGTLSQSLNLSSEITRCITSSFYLALHVNSRMLFLSNSLSSEITAIDLLGKKVFDYTHTDLICPNQCAVDPIGNAYVASPSGNNIHQISPTGQYIRSLLLGEIDSPRGLCFNDTFDKLAVVGGTDKLYLRLYTFV